MTENAGDFLRSSTDSNSHEQPSSILLSLNTLSSRVISPRTRAPPPSDLFCPHSDAVLTAKTYRHHKQLFADATTGKWTKDSRRNADQESRM